MKNFNSVMAFFMELQLETVSKEFHITCRVLPQ
jgi:hypothetical protein